MLLQPVAEWNIHLYCCAVAACGGMKYSSILLCCCSLWRNEEFIYTVVLLQPVAEWSIHLYCCAVAACGGMKYSSIPSCCCWRWSSYQHCVTLRLWRNEVVIYTVMLLQAVAEWSGNLYCLAVSGCGGMKWPIRRQKGWRCWRDLGMLRLMTWKKGLVANSL